ncbi:MAG: LPS-assembly protein LptD [Gammaproteobacteria bacterium]
MRVKQILYVTTGIAMLSCAFTFASQKADFASMDNITLGEYLGWVTDPSLNVCRGYYVEAPFHYSGKGKVGDSYDKTPIELSAKYSDYHIHGKSVFTKNVTLTEPQRKLTADKAYLYTNQKGKLQKVRLEGNVKMHEPGKVLYADVVVIPIETGKKRFTLVNVAYRISLDVFSQDLQHIPEDKPSTYSGLAAWGRAKQVEKNKPKELVLNKATYTTCPPNVKTCAWHLRANKIVLNKETGTGYAYNTTVFAKWLPIFYSPYLRFPIDNRRKSGLLFPTFSHSQNSGYSVTTPFYLNLAPNYDATIYPNYYEKRGMQWGGELRLKTSNSYATLTGSVLPHDREFSSFQDDAQRDYGSSTDPKTISELGKLQDDSDTRTGFRFTDKTTFNEYWEASADYNYVSDDYYLQDLSGSFAEPSDNQLLREGRVNYYGKNWSFLGLLQGYQTLHPVNQDPVYNQYARLPELNLSADYPDLPKGLEYTMNTEYDYFDLKLNPGDTTTPVRGSRVNVRPGLSLPITKPFGFMTPSIQLDATGYDLSHAGTDSDGDNNPSSPTRVLPIFSVDNGLYFDKNTSLFGHGYTQTLEPRLYYLFVPYENQDDLPDFDSQLMTLTYQQLFQNNRFSSVDRIGDANQVSLGATTRFIDDQTGNEKFRFSLGDILYFRDRHVELCTTEECEERDDQRISPVVGEMTYHFNPKWSFTADALYNVTQTLFENASATFQYKPTEKTVFNLAYTFVHEGNIYTESDEDDELYNLSQIHASVALPLTEKWNTLAGVDYNLNYGNGVSYLVGAEYNSCCWGVRFLVDQALTGVEDGENEYNRTYYLQFVLKGLGAFGNSNPESLIGSNISGYNDSFTRAFG